MRERAIETDDQRVAVAIAVGTDPGGDLRRLAIGSFIEDHLGEPWMIAIQLIFFGALLRLRRPAAAAQARSSESTVKDGLYIGLAQVLALAPGTSRSGITITAARYLGLDRDAAARFSFLLADPGRRRRDRLRGGERDPRRPARAGSPAR